MNRRNVLFVLLLDPPLLMCAIGLLAAAALVGAIILGVKP